MCTYHADIFVGRADGLKLHRFAGGAQVEGDVVQVRIASSRFSIFTCALSSGRINWFGRHADWADQIGFRGKEGVESPLDEWTRREDIAEGKHVLYKVIGVVVDKAPFRPADTANGTS